MRTEVIWLLGVIGGFGFGWGAHRDFSPATPIPVYDFSGDRGFIGCTDSGRAIVTNITIAVLPRVPMKPIIDVGAVEEACAPLPLEMRA